MLLVPLLCSLLALSAAYKLGPPLTACKDMVPTGHNADPQTSAPPFSVTTNPAQCYKQGLEMKVVMAVTDTALEIEGVFIQARKQSGDNLDVAVGTFRVTDPVLKTLDCNGKAKSAASHNDEKGVLTRTVYWTPPSGLQEDVMFNATIVVKKIKYWTKVTSKVVKYMDSCTSKSTRASASGVLLLASLTATMLGVFLRA